MAQKFFCLFFLLFSFTTFADDPASTAPRDPKMVSKSLKRLLLGKENLGLRVFNHKDMAHFSSLHFQLDQSPDNKEQVSAQHLDHLIQAFCEPQNLAASDRLVKTFASLRSENKCEAAATVTSDEEIYLGPERREELFYVLKDLKINLTFTMSPVIAEYITNIQKALPKHIDLSISEISEWALKLFSFSLMPQASGMQFVFTTLQKNGKLSDLVLSQDEPYLSFSEEDVELSADLSMNKIAQISLPFFRVRRMEQWKKVGIVRSFEEALSKGLFLYLKLVKEYEPEGTQIGLRTNESIPHYFAPIPWSNEKWDEIRYYKLDLGTKAIRLLNNLFTLNTDKSSVDNIADSISLLETLVSAKAAGKRMGMMSPNGKTFRPLDTLFELTPSPEDFARPPSREWSRFQSDMSDRTFNGKSLDAVIDEAHHISGTPIGFRTLIERYTLPMYIFSESMKRFGWSVVLAVERKPK